MLSKCANPECANKFRYLHEGKLFLVRPSPRKSKRNGLSGLVDESGPPEYAWLCSSCCRHWAVRFDQELGPVVVRNSEPVPDKKFGML